MKTVEEAKWLVESLTPLQENTEEGAGAHIFPCPRCGYNRMEEKAVRNAFSRHADVYICNVCGIDEAVRDMAGQPLPLNQWSMAISFEDQEDDEDDE